jgi:hypothetical protein
MNYMLMICGGGGRTPAEGRRSIDDWVALAEARGVQLGRPLDPPAQATTVRVRGGETLVTDGPFVESKEFVAGFDVMSCDDLDTAVEVATEHPVAATGAVEVRPFRPGLELSSAAREWGRTDPTDSWCLFFYDDAEVETEDPGVDDAAWVEPLTERGIFMFGHALEPAEAATTVRVDGTRTVLTDGPFIEAGEFVGGVAVLTGVSREQAIEAAAAHPRARRHPVEVRRFLDFD